MSIVVQAGSTDSFFLEAGARFDIQGPCEVLVSRWMTKFRVKIGSAEQQVGPFLSDAQVNILATSETTYLVYPAEVWVAPSVLAGVEGAAGVGTTPSGTLIATNVQSALDELDAEKAALAALAATPGASLIGVTGGGTVQDALDNIEDNLNFTTLTAATTPVADADLMILRQGSINKKIDAGTFRTEFAVDAVAAQDAAEASATEAAGYAASASTGAKFYDTIAAGRTAVADTETFGVKAGGSDELARPTVYRRDSSSTQTALYAIVPASEFDDVFDRTSYNRIDPTAADYVYRYSPSTNALAIDSIGVAASERIAVVPGNWYTVSGLGIFALLAGPSGGYFADLESATAVDDITFSASLSGTGKMFQVPDGIQFVIINLVKLGGDPEATTLNAPAQLEEGQHVTEYREFSDAPIVKHSYLPEDVVLVDSEALEPYAKTSDLVELYSYNKIDLDAINYVLRYTTGGMGFTTDAIGFAASGHFPVQEGSKYIVNGPGLVNPTAPQGGYFTSSTGTSSVQNITFTDPPIGSGKVFEVPTGLGITHAVVSLKKAGGDPEATTLDGEVQVEEGDRATDWQAYSASTKIKRSLTRPAEAIPGTTPGTSFDAEAWYRFTEGDEGGFLADKIPVFRRKWLDRTADLCVANTGTSLTARTIEHCTAHVNATTRPPLMHSNNFASLIWDKLAWEGQQYRRYDAAGSFFTETGTFATAASAAEWDDSSRRDGLTRYSSGTDAAVAFTVPVGAWQFNFIHRTDSVGCTAQVVIAEGNSKMQAYDEGTATWVEANGYSFSMLEATPVTRDISVPNPAGGANSTINIASKGNTTYQKRLKMRCTVRNSTKAVTISRTSGTRFMYWGVEWSPREHMITYINAARGSHDTQATSSLGLPRFQDNDIWSFKPDLMLFELPIHNDGALGATGYAQNYWANLTNNFVFRADYELSMKARSAFYGLDPEIAMFTSSIAYNFGGIEEDGTLKFGAETGTGRMMTALDKYAEAHRYVIENHPDAVSIHAAARWVAAGIAIHGDLKTATLGSGPAGLTFTNEGSHWNNTGSKIMAKVVTPLINFIH